MRLIKTISVLNTSTSLQTKLSADTYVAEGKLLLEDPTSNSEAVSEMEE